MHHLFAPFVNHLESIVSHGGYTVILVTSILEGIPLVGSAIPGHTVIILAGFLAKLGVLNLPVVMFLGAFGAILGDSIAYALGAKYGYGFLEKMSQYLSIRPEHLEKAKQVVARNTGKAIIFGRFSPITRPLMPFIVGASGVHKKKFWLYDIIGGVMWSVASVLAGYIFGAGYGAISGYIGKFVGAGIIIALILIWTYRFINKKWHIFVRYDIFTLVLMLIALYGTFETIQDTVSRNEPIALVDISTNLWMAAHMNEAMVLFMKIVTNVFSPLMLGIFTVVGIGAYVYKKKWEAAAFLTLSVGGVLMWTGFIKDLVMRLRPDNMLVQYLDYSFPSLHAGMIAFASLAFIYLFAIHMKKLVWREVAIAVAVLLAVLVGFSRIYLNVHWLSDVVAGYCLAVLWTTMMVLFVKYMVVLLKPLTDRNS